METRKVQLAGGTTYTVSLPKSWAEEQGIVAGSTLSLYPEDDGSLLIQSGTETDLSPKKTTVNISSYNEKQLRETVHSLYLGGFDSITLTNTDGATIPVQRLVSDIISTLIGFEMMDTTSDSILIENLTDAAHISVRKSTLRLRLITLGMHQDAMTAIFTNDTELAQQVMVRDDEVDRLFAIVTRYFQRSLSTLQEVEQLEITRPELFYYYHISRQLERVADHSEKLASLVIDQEIQLTDPETMQELGSRSRSVIEQSTDVVLSDRHISSAYDALDQRDTVVGEIEAYDRSHTLSSTHRLLLDSLKRTADYGANTAKIAIQRSARNGELPGQN